MPSTKSLSHRQSLPSPYLNFSREAWSALRADAPLTLHEGDLARLQAYNEPVSLDEVQAIYLPLSRLLAFYVQATQDLHRASHAFLGTDVGKTPFILGVAGSVAVGKSTTARVLQAMLQRWSSMPRVELITTDGFLYPNAVLEERGLMNRKGFPESYDTSALLRFLDRVKAGEPCVKAPKYSHLTYDVLPDEVLEVRQPDILIVEGLNVLQPARLPRDGQAIPFVSDYFDFSIYIDAHEDDLASWYVDRFLKLRATAFQDPRSYFHRFAHVDDRDALSLAHKLWGSINLVNLRENILPTRQRADLILTKSGGHRIEHVQLRRL